MNNHIEVINRMMELVETMGEGLEYIQEKLERDEPEKAVKMLLDTTHAFASIEESLHSVLSELPEEGIQEKTDTLRSALAEIVREYEKGQGHLALDIFKLELYPAFNRWREELERVLKPYTMS